MKRLILLLITLSVSGLYAQKGKNEAMEYFKAAERKYENRKYNEAIELYSKAIKEDDKQVNFFIRRAFCYSLTQDFEAAIEDYSRVIELDPQNKFAFISRGSAKSKIGLYKDAIKDFDRALLIDPKDCEAYNNRGFAKKQAGMKDAACDDWNRSKKLGNEEAKIILKNNRCN